MDDRKHKSCGSGTKDFITQGTASILSISTHVSFPHSRLPWGQLAVSRGRATQALQERSPNTREPGPEPERAANRLALGSRGKCYLWLPTLFTIQTSLKHTVWLNGIQHPAHKMGQRHRLKENCLPLNLFVWYIHTWGWKARNSPDGLRLLAKLYGEHIH